MKIDVIFTGGTIGSRLDDNGYISNSEDAPFLLLEKYKEAYGGGQDFVTHSPYEILSENLSAEHLLRLIQEVHSIVEKDLAVRKLIDIEKEASADVQARTDGIIITHGTDSLQYTAAILGYVFADVQIPIVLVSSAYVLDHPSANGLHNFVYAVSLIKTYASGEFKKGGVFVSYVNDAEKTSPYHLGVRLLPHMTCDADVYSIDGPLPGWMDRREVNKEVGVSDYVYGNNPFTTLLKEDRLNLSKDTQAILRLQVNPGIYYPELNDQVKVILIETYHSGTMAVTEDFKRFLENAREKNIPVFLVGMDFDRDQYETVEAYKDLAIICLPKASGLSIYCKLWLGISNGFELIPYMKKNIAGEYKKSVDIDSIF